MAKFTDAYAGILAVRKRLHLVVWRLHKEHGMTPSHACPQDVDQVPGPVIRLAPNRLLFNTPTAFRSRLPPVMGFIVVLIVVDKPSIDMMTALRSHLRTSS
jgi:hypothetical protein